MKKTLLLTVFLLAVVSIVKADVEIVGDGEIIQIGPDEGTESSTSLPTTSNWNYSLTQQVYTIAEIGMGGTITSIAFYNEGIERERDIDLYMLHTDMTDILSDGQFNWRIPAQLSDRVFSGNVTFVKDGWTTIQLDSPFEYNGISNLAVITDDNTGRYVGPDLVFRTFSTSPIQTASVCSDVTNYDPSTSPSYEMSVQQSKNCIQLTISGGFIPPFPNGDVIEIGLGGTSVISLPLSSDRKYSLSQQIYTSDELGKAQDLTSISFYNVGRETNRLIDIYLVHTDKNSFSRYDEEFANSCDWVSYSDADRVFSGEVTFYEDDWSTIPFNMPFHYNGTDNLALIVDDNTGTECWNLDFLAFYANEQSLCTYVDRVDINAFNIGSYMGDIYPMKNQLKFNDVDLSPERPSEIYAVPTKEGATVFWTSVGNKWNLQYKPYYGYEWTDVFGLTSPSYEITNLASDQRYLVRVQTVYENGTRSHWFSGDFYTRGDHTVPYDVVVDASYDFAFFSWRGNSESYEVWYRTAGWSFNEILFCQDFEETSNGQLPEGWTTIDADGDGYCWELGSQPSSYFNTSFEGNGLWGSSDFAVSGSYSKVTDQALTPDNYLVSPKVTLGGTFIFFASAQDKLYPNEHFGVAISTKSNTNPKHFVTIEEWTLNADGSGTKSSRRKDQGSWGEFEVDLSAYAGQEGYIAIRHFGCSDQLALSIDDICLYGDEITIPAGEWNIVETPETFAFIDGLEQGVLYDYKIIAKQSGEPDMATDIGNFYTLYPETLCLQSDVDNSGILEYYDGQVVNVCIANRVLRKDGTWQSICLPFDLSLAGSPLEGADVRMVDFATMQGGLVVFHCFTSVTELQAGVPYLIRWENGGDDICDPVFYNVFIKNTHSPITLLNGQAVFDGKYSPTLVEGDNWYYFEGHSLIQGSSNLQNSSSVDAFQGYFSIDVNLNATIDGIGLNFGNMNEMITGVSSISETEERVEMYNLAGQRIGKVRKGVNIVNGKKVLVK